MAIRAKEGAGPEGWWKFRGRVEKGTGGEEGIIERISESVELGDLTRKNCVKVLRFRVGQSTETIVEGSDTLDSTEIIPEADSSTLPIPSTSNSIILSPTTAFLNLTHNHYLRSLATLSLSITPTLDPLKSLKQISARLNPTDERGPPKLVYTLPRSGRSPKAGERTDGWGEIVDGEPLDSAVVTEIGSKRGGPIGRAKGSRGREGRRQEWTGTKRSSEELAGAEI